LSPTPNENLKIIEDPNLGPMIQNITEAFFTNPSEVKTLLEEGENRRHFGVTNMNAHSSRSHVIVRLCIESRRVLTRPANALRQNWGKDRPNCISTLNLVDLAGSERANKAGTSGQSLKEGSYINRSLLNLGTVIANLSEGKLQHIPYRNSKLTRLLATALGGNAKTCVITCISPASGNLAESLNTLRFASRAKRIVNHVQKNEIMDMKTLTNKLALQMSEIEHLRNQLELSKQMGFTPDDEDQGESLRDKAIIISKNWRSTRFLLQNGAKIMNGLRLTGMSHLAKKVPSDIRAVVTGTRDVSEVMDEYSNIVSTYLSHDRKLLAKINEVVMNNEADAVLSQSNIYENMTEDLDGSDDNANNAVSATSLQMDLFQMLESGGEEMKESLETAYFHTEEVIAISSKQFEISQKEVHELNQKERQLKKSIEELQSTIIDKNEMIKVSKTNEATLLKQLDDMKAQFKNENKSHNDLVAQLQAHINKLELKLTDSEANVHVKHEELVLRDYEIDKYRSQIESLNNELVATIQSKKQLEEESQRQRAEMRMQMERLRKNMHELLVQGGEEAKVIETHNTQLQRELDKAKDDLEIFAQTKERLESELMQLRSQISILTEDVKVQFNTSSKLKEEVS
jgi:hypothetical protein